MWERWKRNGLAIIKRALRWADRYLPAGIRSLLGLLLMVGGVLGFLPVLGFWMLPLGAAFIALDIPPLRRRLLAWQRSRSVPRDNSRANGKNEKRTRAR